jgi:cellulose synthase/poly-beta-1,6-N-acetylglucosamine synthase-like glycosyltransferase
MIFAALSIVATLGLLIVGQVVLAVGFTRNLRRPQPTLDDADCPKVAAILCLRGVDPSLPHCLDGLLDQDYPRYDVWIVVDHADDPACEVAQQAIQRRGAANVRIHVLSQPRETCSLKCASLLEALDEIDESYAAVALLDADTIPHRSWLRQLVAPLVADPRLGLTYGNRWYAPCRPTLGSLLRYCWNMVAVIEMDWFGIPWGGSLVIRRRVLDEAGIRSLWERGISDDVPLYAALRKHGWRVRFVGPLMMVNQEECTTPGFYAWSQRQLLVARLYHPHWWAVLVHGLATSAAQAAALAGGLAALAFGQTLLAEILLGGLLGYLVFLFVAAMIIERRVRLALLARDSAADPPPPLRWPRLLWAIPITQYVYLAALVKACFIRRILWRGIEYRIRAPYAIHMTRYTPYLQVPSSTADAESLH